MLSQLQQRKLIKLFSMYDTENNGILKLANFEHIAHRLAQLKGWKANTPKYQALEQQYAYRWIRLRGNIKEATHHPPDYKIDLNEWLEYHQKLLEQEQFRQDIKSLGAVIFEVADLDENGRLDQQEWKTIFQVYNIPVVYCQSTFTQLDTDKDGFLRREEILSFLQEFYFSNDSQARGNYMFGPF